MHPIIYDVAVSLDGFIAGLSGDISKFAHEGPVVDDYVKRLQTYKLAIMGRKTYEFGYGFGLKPGQNPYPHMKTVVCSATLEVPEKAEISVLRSPKPEEILTLAHSAGGPVYLCGGGEFPGWMLDQGLINRIILKRAPCVLGGGTTLFGACRRPVGLSHVQTRPYENGYLLEEFDA